MQTRHSARLALVGIILSAAVLLLVGSWFCYTSTFDTATVGLMSINILHGERPLFYYGQPYFGALEAYLAALYLALFGFSEFVVSLSPITFTLGWVFFSYLLFTRVHNRTAGLIAAACTAFPGYYIFWYSIATYGGYSAILCIGTAILWLCLRMLQENVQRKALVFHSLCLGVLIGLGIWVHPLTFPYIAIGTGILAVFTIKERFRPDILLSLALAVLIALAGFLPFYFETGSFLSGVSESVQLSWTFIIKALSNLFAVNIFELVVWNFRHSFETQGLGSLIEYGSISVFCMAVLMAGYVVISSGIRRDKRYNFLIPLSYCLLFLSLYVQHHLSTIKAPRYAIGFWCMLSCMVWSLALSGQTKRAVRTISTALFCIWIAYQITGTVFFIVGNTASTRKEQIAVLNVVDAARAKNLTSVILYGDHFFGFKGQKFSMYAQNEIVFPNADLERYQANAQAAETDLNRGYLASESSRISLENTLKELGVSYTVEKIDDYFLFSDLHPAQRYTMQAIPSKEIHLLLPEGEKSRKIWGLLGDRNQDYENAQLSFSGTSFSLDTGRLRKLCGLWMFSFQNPNADHWKGFGRYEVHVSQDGISYKKVYSSLPNTANGFHAGPQIYIGGLLGKGEALFAPVLARYIKISFLGKIPSPITELFVFQSNGSLREDGADDMTRLAQLVREQGLDFVLADRWVSGNLREAFRGSNKADIALPRHSTRFKNKPLRYFIKPEKGQGLVCDRDVADECEQTLKRAYGASVISSRFDLRNYTLFSLADTELHIGSTDRSALLWNGHVPLQTKDMTLLAHWFNTLGLPIWRADFTKTKGVYHDYWTNGKGKFYDLNYKVNHEKDRELMIYTHGWRPDNDIASLQLTVLINNNIPLQFKEKRENVYIFSLPKSMDELDSITIESTTFIPNSKDARSLGLDIDRIEIQ